MDRIKPKAAAEAEAAFMREQNRRDLELGPTGLREAADVAQHEGAGVIGTLIARSMRARADLLERGDG